MPFTLQMAFNELVAGVFTLDSALDGPDALSDLGLFDGTFDDITDDVDDQGVTVTTGTDSLAGTVQASSLTATVARVDDPGFWNPNNPSSPLNSVFPGFRPFRPAKLIEIGDGIADTPLTVSGNEVTDESRAAALQWGTGQQGGQTDGLQADSSFGIRRAATNLFRHGQCDSSVDWNVAGGGTRSTAVDAAVAAPFAPQSIKFTCAGDAFGQGVYCDSALGQAAAAGTNGVGSIYFKGVAGQSYYSVMSWTGTDASTNDDPTAFIFNATGDWQLITPEALAVPAGKVGDRLRIRVSVHGTRAETFHVAHAMLEKGQSVVAPYVATSGGATATHPAGRVQADAGLLESTAGGSITWLRMGWASTSNPKGGGANGSATFFVGNTATTGLETYFREGSQDFRVRVWSGGAALVDAATTVQHFAAGDLVAICGKWDTIGGQLRAGVAANGVAFAYAQSALAPFVLPATFDIGSTGVGAVQIDSDVLCVLTFTGTLTDAEWAAVYALGPDRQPSEYQELLSSATVTAVMPMDDTSYLIPDVEYDTFYGFLRRASWQATSRSCQLYFEDMLFRASRVFPVIASTGPTTTGAVFHLVLDAIGWPAGDEWRTIATGDDLDDFSADGSLTANQIFAALVEAERGTAFVAGKRFVYESRDMAQTRLPSGTLSTDLNLEELESGIDADSIHTKVTVTRTDPPGGGADLVWISGVDSVTEKTDGEAEADPITSPYVPADGGQQLADDIVYEGVNGRPPVTATAAAVEGDAETLQLILSSPLQTVFDIDDPVGGTEGDYIVQGATHTLQTGIRRAQYTLTRRVARAFALDSPLDGSDVFRY